MKNLSEKIFFFPGYSDTRILLYTINWKAYGEFWRYLTLSNHNAYTFIKICVVDAFKWYLELFSTSLRVVSRRKFGNQTFGVILALCTAVLMWLFNLDVTFQGVVIFAKEIGKGIRSIFTEETMHWSSAFNGILRPKSMYLFGHCILFLLLSLYHILAIYFVKKWRNTENTMAKGESYFYSLFKPYCSVSLRYFNVYFEGAFFFLLGVFFLSIIGDTRYGVFLIIGSLCLFIQEFVDHCIQQLHKV